MIRIYTVALFCSVFAFAPVHAQEWARKMFATHSHDFGVVPRAGKSEFDFTFKNLYRDDVHISAVKASCGCTTPIIVTPTVKSLETGVIRARFNTRSFLGKRKAIITVKIDRPLQAEVQLTIRGYVRRDVVLEPGLVDFGRVDSGTAEKSVRIHYAGNTRWKITDVRSSNPAIQAELKELGRYGGKVNYDLVVKINGDIEPGYLNDEVQLVTNDTLRTVRVAVQGHVVSPLSVSPNNLTFGVLAPGETVTKRLVVRANKPFKILSVNCPDDCFDIETNEESKKLHFVPVVFTAGEAPGTIQGQLLIKTDLSGGKQTTCTLTATVKASEVGIQTSITTEQ